jgi:hypothetical protein
MCDGAQLSGFGSAMAERLNSEVNAGLTLALVCGTEQTALRIARTFVLGHPITRSLKTVRQIN